MDKFSRSLKNPSRTSHSRERNVSSITWSTHKRSRVLSPGRLKCLNFNLIRMLNSSIFSSRPLIPSSIHMSLSWWSISKSRLSCRESQVLESPFWLGSCFRTLRKGKASQLFSSTSQHRPKRKKYNWPLKASSSKKEKLCLAPDPPKKSVSSSMTSICQHSSFMELSLVFNFSDNLWIWEGCMTDTNSSSNKFKIRR